MQLPSGGVEGSGVVQNVVLERVLLPRMKMNSSCQRVYLLEFMSRVMGMRLWMFYTAMACTCRFRWKAAAS